MSERLAELDRLIKLGYGDVPAACIPVPRREVGMRPNPIRPPVTTPTVTPPAPCGAPECRVLSGRLSRIVAEVDELRGIVRSLEEMRYLVGRLEEIRPLLRLLEERAQLYASVSAGSEIP